MKHIFLIFFLKLICLSSYCQYNTEISHYLFKDFTEGQVLMKTGVKNKQMINYNTLTEEIVFDVKGKKMAISMDKQNLIDTIYVQGIKFILRNDKFLGKISNSKFDLLFKRKSKIIPSGNKSAYGGTSQTSSVINRSSFETSGQVYEVKLSKEFQIKSSTCFWLEKGHKSKKFSSMRQLKKIYKNKIDLLKGYVKKNKVKYNDIENIINLIDYLESTKNQI